MPLPPLKPLHVETALSATKLSQFERFATETLVSSLVPGEPGSLKCREDGTLLDGHHRIHILRRRGVDVDLLPREIVKKAGLGG